MSLGTKVLIVGGGPAGAIAARNLAEGGIDVILLERNLSFEKPCGGGVTISVFEELGIPRALMRKEVENIRIVPPSGEKVDIGLKGDNMAIVKRGDFDRTLRGEAEKKGAGIIEGEFEGIESVGKSYKVKARIKGLKTEMTAEYIIAADGVNSRVRAALGIKPAKTIFTMSEKIKGVETEFCEFWFGSYHAAGFYSWVFPAEEGISTGTGSLEPGKVRPLFERFKKRRGISKEGLKRIYKLPIWKGDLYNKGNVIFVGDSASQVMPLTYEGIYYAMKAGEFAARAIIEGKAGNYKRMWKARFQKRFFIMDRLKNYFFKSDHNAEKFVALHRRSEVQEASMGLWLGKDVSRESLQSYIKMFGKFIC